MEPNYAHYFVRGSIYRMMQNTKEANNDFDTFLRQGDPGTLLLSYPFSLLLAFYPLTLLSFVVIEDRKVPNAYFGKVQHYIAVNDIAKAEEAFALGCQKGFLSYLKCILI